MITLDDIRKDAMALPDVEEKEHFRLPGFRVRDKLFAHVEKDETTAIVTLDQATAALAAAAEPEVCREVWRRNETIFVGLRVDLARVTRRRMKELVELAWRNKAPRQLVAAYDDEK